MNGNSTLLSIIAITFSLGMFGGWIINTIANGKEQDRMQRRIFKMENDMQKLTEKANATYCDFIKIRMHLMAAIANITGKGGAE